MKRTDIKCVKTIVELYFYSLVHRGNVPNSMDEVANWLRSVGLDPGNPKVIDDTTSVFNTMSRQGKI